MKNNGILLCAVGSQEYYDLCNTIIRDIKELMPEIPIAVYTDNKRQIKYADIHIKGVHNPDLVFLSKIKACQVSPFDKTIFIDVDCRVLRPIDHLFKILETHDLGIVFATSRKQLKDNWDPDEAGIPLCSSTLLFKKNKSIIDLFKIWESEYSSQVKFPGHGDQYYLHYLIYYNMDIRYFVLPDEYHLNTGHPASIAGSVKIISNLISDVDHLGEISRARLDKIFNPTGINERTVLVKLLDGSRWQTSSYYLSKRIRIKVINNTPVLKLLKPLKILFKKFK